MRLIFVAIFFYYIFTIFFVAIFFFTNVQYNQGVKSFIWIVFSVKLAFHNYICRKDRLGQESSIPKLRNAISRSHLFIGEWEGQYERIITNFGVVRVCFLDCTYIIYFKINIWNFFFYNYFILWVLNKSFIYIIQASIFVRCDFDQILFCQIATLFVRYVSFIYLNTCRFRHTH